MLDIFRPIFVKNKPEDDQSIVETYSLCNYLEEQSSCADVHYLVLYYINLLLCWLKPETILFSFFWLSGNLNRDIFL